MDLSRRETELELRVVTMERKKIAVGELRLGMYVAELDRPWIGSPFLFQGFPISTDKELKQLNDFCDFVYIDLEQSRDVDVRPKLSSTSQNQQHRFETERVNLSHKFGQTDQEVKYHNKIKFSQALPQAAKIFGSTRKYVNSIFHDIRLGKSINTDEARELTDRMVDNIINNENAMVLLTQLKQKDEYTTLHSINVCIISILFGRHMGFDEKELRLLGLGALLHDIGKMHVPLEILNKPGKLTAFERKIMNSHPQMGYDLLSTTKDFPAAALDVIRYHHERMDGSGYPKGLMAEGIKPYVQIVAMVDVYDAITSDRAYHERISPHEALNKMFESASKHFSKDLLERFISCLGIYPIGSIVELDAGEVGVVITVNRRRKLLPTLNLVLDRDKKYLERPMVLDLDYYERKGKTIKIKKILKSNSYGIDVRKILLDNTLAIPATA
ncbi:MAG: HD-GYP domain-containing protein [Gammaproteobacteria bacterium]|nr:HD-GYP domain-containing protein [Gammaproteobacteria bacterium]